MDSFSMQAGSVENFIGGFGQSPSPAKLIPAEVYSRFIKVDHCDPDTVTARIKYASGFIEQAFAGGDVSQQRVRYCHKNGCFTGLIMQVQRFECRFCQRRKLESILVHVQFQINFGSVEIAESYVPSIIEFHHLRSHFREPVESGGVPPLHEMQRTDVVIRLGYNRRNVVVECDLPCGLK